MTEKIINQTHTIRKYIFILYDTRKTNYDRDSEINHIL